MQLKKYDIILKKNSKNPISFLIRLITKDIYSHSEIYVGDYHIIDGMPNGVKVRNFDSSLKEFDTYRYYRELTPKEQYDIEEFLQKAINSKYDFKELFLQLFHKQGKENKKYICISLLMNAFKYANVETDDFKVGFKQISDSKYFIKVNKDTI